MVKDLTKDRPMKIVAAFCAPILVGNLFQQLYSIVDALIVGRTIGLTALAAVGATNAISFLIVGFVQGLTMGFSVITGQLFGGRYEDRVKRSVAVGIIMSLAATVVITLISVVTAKPLLRLMDTPLDIIDRAHAYIVVIYYGIGATVFYNLFSNALRAIGDSRTPLVFLIVASIINVILDLLFILVFHTGVEGAGWATVISQALSAALCYLYMRKKFPLLRLKKRDFTFEKRLAKEELRVGLPMAFQFSITALGVMIIQTVLNGFGSETIAAYTAASKIDAIIGNTLAAVGTGVAAFCAQNYGAKNYRRINQGVNCGLILSAAVSLVGFLAVFLGGKFFIKLFISDVDSEQLDRVLAEGQQYLTLNGAFYMLLSLVFIYRSTLQSIGKSGVTVFAGAAELAMRCAAAILLSSGMGYMGVCIASPLAWLGADILLIAVYYLTMHKLLSGGNGDVKPIRNNRHKLKFAFRH